MPEPTVTAQQATQLLLPIMGFVGWKMYLIIGLGIREMIWKGIALWKSGSKRQMPRFICIFIFNTVGILPIIYLAFFQKKSK
ncbi:MAG: DUF5652 family protein [Candidatus Absconditabacterales bacterium]